MMLNSAVMTVPRRPCMKTLCLASNINTEQLRSQLDQLHTEAVNTRVKANNARLRLMRLSEAAEKLHRQAAICVQTGKENEARELLFQKKKVMQALQKSKSRIEFFDELSSKLTEAISVKETQLIGNVALDVKAGREDAFSPVRIASPKQEVTENSNENEEFNTNALELSEDQELQVYVDSHANQSVDNEQEDLEGSVGMSIWSENDMVNRLRGITSYENFLEHVDQQLSKIESELDTVLRFSTLVLESEEKPKNSKVQQTLELRDSICSIRRRIASIMKKKVDIK